MKFSWIHLLLIPVVLAQGADGYPRAGPGVRAGAAKVEITPPLPATYDLLQTATEIAHPLHARVLYLEDQDDQAILVALDYEGLLRTGYERLRAAIAGATGVPASRIVVNCNHSHNAPWVNLDLAGALLAGRALPVLREAMQRIDGDGFTLASRKVAIPLAPLREHGSQDFVRSMFSRPAINAAAKYPPLQLLELERKFSDALELYQRHKDDRDSYTYVLNLTAYGDRLTLARNLREWSAYDFQALRAGSLCLVFLPGESFIEFALEIREQSGCEQTFVAAYNDLTPVYVPDESAFEEGGYEVSLWCYSTPETGKLMVREALRLVRSLTFVGSSGSTRR